MKRFPSSIQGSVPHQTKPTPQGGGGETAGVSILIEGDVRVIDADLLEKAEIVILLPPQPGRTEAHADAYLRRLLTGPDILGMTRRRQHQWSGQRRRSQGRELQGQHWKKWRNI